MNPLSPPLVVALAGLALGLAFGAVARASSFCTMGAVSDWVLLGDRRRFRAWMLAVAVAILATQGLHLAGLVDLGRAAPLGGPWRWAGALLGGVAFGVGMVWAGGCGAQTLVRLGGGSLKALVVTLLAGLAAGVTAKGLLAPLRLWLDTVGAVPVIRLGAAEASLPGLGLAAGLGAVWAHALPALAAGGGLLVWSLADRGFRATPRLWGAGAAVGLLVAGGWAASGIWGADPFDPVPMVSLSFLGPMGDGLLYLMTFTGASLTFGVAAAGGVVAGAAAVALASGGLRAEGFADRADLVAHLKGAGLMGVGAVLAGGCTIGQGVSGMSLLSLTAPLALVGIVGGAVWALRGLEEGGMAAGLRAMLRRT